MKQLTIRGFDEELERRLRGVARREGVSLNRAALILLRRGAGLRSPSEGPDVVGDSLDQLIGSWRAEEAREFDEAVSVFEAVDEELWR
jgi:plasmid stability protein